MFYTHGSEAVMETNPLQASGERINRTLSEENATGAKQGETPSDVGFVYSLLL